MTDETRELFDAPWKADVCCEIHDKNERLICICCPGEQHIANRLARLPELYDALVCASFEYCKGCTKSFSSPDSFLSDGCAGKDGFCPAVFWWETLRKVRDGK